MVDKYNEDVLRVAVAQICQTIGYNSSQAAPLELLQDVLKRFLIEISRNLHSKTEHANRTLPTLRDLYLSMNNMNLHTGDLFEYINNVEPVPFAMEIPKYPVYKEMKLNFLKPGSAEILSRPVYINDYLPSLNSPELVTYSNLKDNSFVQNNNVLSDISSETTAEISLPKENWSEEQIPESSINNENFKTIIQSSNFEASFKNTLLKNSDEKSAPLREISSVLMTTGGYISPATEGKLPEAIIPDIIDILKGLDAPPAVIQGTSSNQELKNVSMDEKTSIEDFLTKPCEKLNPSVKLETKLETLSKSLQKTICQTTKKTIKKNKRKQMPISEDTHNFNTNSTLSKSQEKAQRKAFKILQKLTKSISESSVDSKMNINPALLATLPQDCPQRIQLEKLLKKQAKQRQKVIKQQKVQELFAKQQLLHADTLHTHLSNKSLPIADITQPNSTYLYHPESTSRVLLQTRPEMPCVSSEQTNIMKSTIEIQNPKLLAELSNQAEHIQNDTIAPNNNLTKQTTLDSQTEIKLSTEPDRTKLNIIKKISKQKITKSTLSPNLNTVQKVFNNVNEVQSLINLPSGTTITPAPLLEPLDLVTESINKSSSMSNIAKQGVILGQAPSVISVASAANITIAATDNLLADANKPKKRGRKPGSKNQVKALQPIMQQKKSKQKLDKPIYGPNMKLNHLQSRMMVEPLNLKNTIFPNQLNINTNLTSQKDINVCNMLKSQVSPLNERKDRKKYKTKLNIDSYSQTTHNISDKDYMDSKNINAGLISQKESGEPNLGLLPSPTQTNINKTSYNTKKPQISPINQLSPNMTHPLLNPLNTPFQNKQPNMLPIISLLPYPRPGLIPTGPGLFPTSAFGSKPAANASNILLPQYLSFPMLSSTNTTGNLQPTQHEKNLKLTEKLDLKNDWNLQNLSFPLEATKLAVPDTPLKGLENNFIQKEMKPPIKIEDKIINASKKKFIPDTISLYGFKSLSNKLTTADNFEEPIEVSDDSNESQSIEQKIQLQNSTFQLSQCTSNTQSEQKKYNASLPLENIFSASNIAPLTTTDTKKIKKPKIKNFDHVSLPANNLNLDFMNTEKLSLAGGADLIPLSRMQTGLAYSSHTIPTNSLTATATSIALTPIIATIAQQQSSESETFKPQKPLDVGITILPANNPTILEFKKRKEHKKIKKIKEGKIKKKKEKKDKSKNKERFDDKQSVYKKDKLAREIDKKIKKEKKRDKQRFLIDNTPNMNVLTVNTSINLNNAPSEIEPKKESIVISSTAPSIPMPASEETTTLISPKVISSPNQVPKITLKLGGNSKSTTPLPFDELQEKSLIIAENEARVQSPELARFSPLVTRPPKQKQTENSTVGSVNCMSKSIIGSCETIINHHPILPSSNNWLQGGTLSASSVLLPQQLMQTTKPSVTNVQVNTGNANTVNEKTVQSLPQVPESNRPSSYVDAEGNRIWICPACGKVDDGSPMIGCDGCDAWYHWVCVGILVAPKDNEDWFCRVCLTKKKVHGSEKKRKRSKKK